MNKLYMLGTIMLPTCSRDYICDIVRVTLSPTGHETNFESMLCSQLYTKQVNTTLNNKKRWSVQG